MLLSLRIMQVFSFVVLSQLTMQMMSRAEAQGNEVSSRTVLNREAVFANEVERRDVNQRAERQLPDHPSVNIVKWRLDELNIDQAVTASYQVTGIATDNADLQIAGFNGELFEFRIKRVDQGPNGLLFVHGVGTGDHQVLNMSIDEVNRECLAQIQIGSRNLLVKKVPDSQFHILVETQSTVDLSDDSLDADELLELQQEERTQRNKELKKRNLN